MMAVTGRKERRAAQLARVARKVKHPAVAWRLVGAGSCCKPAKSLVRIGYRVVCGWRVKKTRLRLGQRTLSAVATSESAPPTPARFNPLHADESQLGFLTTQQTITSSFPRQDLFAFWEAQAICGVTSIVYLIFSAVLFSPCSTNELVIFQERLSSRRLPSVASCTVTQQKHTTLQSDSSSPF